MLKIENLSCHYGVVRALDQINLHIKSEGIYAIIGANGAGKSTLVNTVAGLVKPSSGSITYNDVDVTKMQSKDIIRQGIALCPEGRRIFKSVTVRENLMAGAYTLKDKELIAHNIDDVYQLFPRLKERDRQIAGTLSGGEQQMLAIGRALMSNPSLVLLDEPSMGLAPNLIDLVFDTIVQIYEERKINSIVVEQNSQAALSIANYAYVLEVGQLALEGTGEELLSNDSVIDKYLGTKIEN